MSPACAPRDLVEPGALEKRARSASARTAPVTERVADELSEREREVLTLVARGFSDAGIAEQLVLSPHTVHRHIANIRTKLNLPSRASFAVRTGLG